MKTPKELFDALSKTVFGQKEAKKALSVLLTQTDPYYLENNPVTFNPRVLLVGQTGSGKTFLVNELDRLINDKQYATRIFIYIDCTTILPAGAVDGGIKAIDLPRHIETTINKYLTANSVPKNIWATYASSFVIVLDEIDKLCMPSNDSFYKRAQADLLTLLEGRDLDLSIASYGTLNADKVNITINTKSIPIILMGAFAFADLYNTSVKKSGGIGFFREADTVEKPHLKDTLKENGLLTEISGRIGKAILMDKLNYQFLADILENQLLPLFNSHIKTYSVGFRSSYKDELIEKAIKSGEGARSLKSLIFNDIEDYLFDGLIDESKYDPKSLHMDEKSDALYLR